MFPREFKNWKYKMQVGTTINLIIIIIIFLAHQHKAAGMKIKLSKNNDHDGILLGVKSA